LNAYSFGVVDAKWVFKTVRLENDVKELLL
jgi:hypothetical protein